MGAAAQYYTIQARQHVAADHTSPLLRLPHRDSHEQKGKVTGGKQSLCLREPSTFYSGAPASVDGSGAPASVDGSGVPDSVGDFRVSDSVGGSTGETLTGGWGSIDVEGFAALALATGCGCILGDEHSDGWLVHASTRCHMRL